MSDTRSGGCLCGAVRYVVSGPFRPIVACHCKVCRRVTGHFFAATQVFTKNLRLEADGGLQWYQSSPGARRGFCSVCGSTLFFERRGKGVTTIAAGSLDDTSDLRLVHHIYTAYAGDYYTIDDDLPKSPEQGNTPKLVD